MMIRIMILLLHKCNIQTECLYRANRQYNYAAALIEEGQKDFTLLESSLCSFVLQKTPNSNTKYHCVFSFNSDS